MADDGDGDALLLESDAPEAPANQLRGTCRRGALAGAALIVAAALHGVLVRRAPGASTAPTGLWQEASTASRKGSFLVIGDWGFDYACHGNVPQVQCQQVIADRMLEKFKELGDVKFIINVGDSFYPHGVASRSDPQWRSKWREVYHEQLRSVPWYSVMGNHDYQHDPCACSTNIADCAQVNADAGDLDHFYMPALSWFKEHPELDLEVVAMDTNHFMLGYMQNLGYEQHHFEDCQYSPCEQQCKTIAKTRAEEALELFRERASKSAAKNLLVFSHYPTDYFTSRPEFLQGLGDASKHDILYFGGHRHNIDQTSTASIAPNVNWLVGGGGGWSCDGQNQGFLVGEIGMDKISTYPVLVDAAVCCRGVTPPSKWIGQGCEWLGCDNCIDPNMCECRRLNPNSPCTQCNATGHSTPIGRVCSGSACSPPSPPM